MKQIIPLLIISIMVVGCGTARTVIVHPINAHTKYKGVTVSHVKGSLAVPAEAIKKFEDELKEHLYEDSFHEFQDLKIQYSFICHEEGNRFVRWFFKGNGNMGEATLIVRVKFLSSTGSLLGEIDVDGKLNQGFLGGSQYEPLYRVAEKIAENAALWFAIDQDS